MCTWCSIFCNIRPTRRSSRRATYFNPVDGVGDREIERRAAIADLHRQLASPLQGIISSGETKTTHAVEQVDVRLVFQLEGPFRFVSAVVAGV